MKYKIIFFLFEDRTLIKTMDADNTRQQIYTILHQQLELSAGYILRLYGTSTTRHHLRHFFVTWNGSLIPLKEFLETYVNPFMLYELNGAQYIVLPQTDFDYIELAIVQGYETVKLL